MQKDLRLRLFAPLLFSFLFLLTTDLIAAGSSEQSGAPIDILGMVADHDYLEVAGKKVYLPRILYVDGSFHFYPNTHSALESGEFLLRDGVMIRADGEPVSIDFSITSHLMYVWFSMILTFLFAFWAARRYRNGVGAESEPKGVMQNIFEILYLFIRDEIAKEYISGEKHRKYVNYLFSVFMVIALMNLFGLLPWGVSATADLTVTATLAAITFFVTQMSGSRDHWEHVFLFPGVPPLIRIILTPVEILGLFTKPFALAIRLFANMLSGKIMIVCILGLIFIFTDLFGATFGVSSGVVWVALTVVLYVLKAFIALLQAYIFTMLSAVFIGAAAETEHDKELESSVAASEPTV